MGGETVLVTGSSHGLGRCIAIDFSRKGYNLIVHGRDSKALDEVKREIKKNGVECIAVLGDITSEAVIDSLARGAELHNATIVVNNAGTYLNEAVLKTSCKELRHLMEVNFFATAMLTRKIFPALLKGGKGVIANINSLAGKQGSYGESAYSASKHALKGFSESLKYEAIKNGVRIIDFYFGAIATRMSEGRKDSGLLIQPEEAASVVVQNCKWHKSLNVSEVTVGRGRYE